LKGRKYLNPQIPANTDIVISFNRLIIRKVLTKPVETILNPCMTLTASREVEHQLQPCQIMRTFILP
jgi:hypothetical protein